MARPKNDGKYVNFHMDAEIYAALVKFTEETGLTKIMTMERALRQHIELSNGYTWKEEKPIPNISLKEYIAQ